MSPKESKIWFLKMILNNTLKINNSEYVMHLFGLIVKLSH